MQISEMQQYLPHFVTPEAKNEKIYLVAGDLGGTKTNLAICSVVNGELDMIRDEKFASKDHENFAELIREFIAESPETPPQRICIGVAGPVVDGEVDLTNLSRSLSEADIRKGTGVQSVALINDLEATAYGLATLSASHLTTIHTGEKNAAGNMAIIAPGTGLGMAGIYWDGKLHHPFPTEGGHTDFAPRTDLDILLMRYLQDKYEIVSAERVISGPGLKDIFEFLRDVKGLEEPYALRTAIANGDAAAEISKGAIEADIPICNKTMELFVRYLARESSNLVLKLKATGGLFLGGGIPPRISQLLQTGEFYHHYMQSDRMAELLSSVPIHIVANDKAALWGAAYYATLMK